jgi:hypothetical protein
MIPNSEGLLPRASRHSSRTSARSGASSPKKGPGALKSKDDRVAQVVAKYRIDKTQAHRDVDAVMKGRQI